MTDTTDARKDTHHLAESECMALPPHDRWGSTLTVTSGGTGGVGWLSGGGVRFIASVTGGGEGEGVVPDPEVTRAFRRADLRSAYGAFMIALGYEIVAEGTRRDWLGRRRYNITLVRPRRAWRAH